MSSSTSLSSVGSSSSSGTRPNFSSCHGPLPSVLAPAPFINGTHLPTPDSSSFSYQPYSSWQSTAPSSSSSSASSYTTSYRTGPQAYQLPSLASVSSGPAIPTALEANPYAHLYTSTVPEPGAPNSAGT